MKGNGILQWQCGDRRLTVGRRPLVMGILNVTPDSFSDGGRYFDSQQAIARGLQIAEEAADIVDVGGESTRPGAAEVTEEEELERVIPVIEALAARTGAVLSIDTSKAVVAEKAVAAGARIINDVSALTHDAEMIEVARRTGAGVILMHMRGSPRTMQKEPRYDDVVGEVADYLAGRVEAGLSAGLREEALAVDPGIGFGKTLEHNLGLLANLPRIGACGRPVVVGLSRKSFLGALTDREANQRLAGSLAGLAFCSLNGAHVVRVHDVRESRDAVRVLSALREKQTGVE